MLLALLAALPAPASAWMPFVAIGEEPQRVTSSIVETARLAELARAAYLHRTLDEKTQTLVDAVATKLQTLEPKGLYELLGAVGHKSEEVHSFEVVGRKKKNEYVVDAWGTPPLPTFSSMTGAFTVQPTRTNRYLVTTDLALHLDLDADEVTRFWCGVAEWLESNAGDGGAKRALDAADLAVLDSLESAFPNMARLITRYVGAKDLVAGSPLWFYLHPTFDTEQFAKDYPGLASGLGGQARGSMRARWRLTGSDRLYAFARIDSKAGTRIALIPDLIRIPDGKYRFAVEIELDFAGLEIRVTEFQVGLIIHRDAGGATIEYRFDRVPKIAISGAILDLFSVDLIDALIPSQLETIIHDFYTTLATGDGGRGASWKLSVPANESDPIRIQTRFEMLDNGFVSFWLRAGSGMFGKSEDAKRDLRAFTDAFLTAFDRDFDLFQTSTR